MIGVDDDFRKFDGDEVGLWDWFVELEKKR